MRARLRRRSIVMLALLGLPAAASVASARGMLPPVQAAATPSAGAAEAQGTAVPFVAGERLEYEVRFGSMKVGQGRMIVEGIEDVRGRPSWHAVFAYSGSFIGFKVNDKHETWFDVENFSSRRFHQDIDNPGYDRTRRYEIFPERGMFREGDKPEEPTPANPLDDASFLYFVRTLPLEVGKTYTFSRYFKAQGNPVRIRVLRREKVKVPAGEFSAVVVQPTFQTKGIFSEGGKAEVWITDDPTRMVVQLKSKLSIGSLNLYLKSHNRGATR